MRIGLFGGTFNPIHRGHLLLAEGAIRTLNLDEVWWIPAHLPPHKEVEGKISAQGRARMVELAIQGNPKFCLCRVELERPPPSYTIETVRMLQKQQPNAEWFFLIGSDTAQELPTWREIQELMQRVQFISIPRLGQQGQALPQGVREIPVQTLDLSSSQVREKIRRGESVSEILPPPVLDYIRQRGLYR